MATKTTEFDAAKHMSSAESQAELLTDALESGDAGYIANALGVIARARGMTEVARGAGVTREALLEIQTKSCMRSSPRFTVSLRI
jgi:probable addiction module antidote protein